MFMAPKDVYGVNLMRMFVDELGGQKAVAKHLGVNERSVRRWLDTGKVPRAYVLALYWETKYGRSNIHTSFASCKSSTSRLKTW
jgi:ribonuclease I